MGGNGGPYCLQIIIILNYIQFYIFNMKKMNMEDFDGNYKFKIILPLLSLVCFLINIFGHIYWPSLTSNITRFVTAYILSKITHSLINFLRIFSKASKILDREERYLNGEKRPIYNYQHLHAFIIPSYNQNIQLLQDTLSQLAKHQDAKGRYLVYLGMEKWEKDCDLKAKKLLEQYKSSFKQIGYTIHDIRQYEQKGKASNVSWCVENLQETYFKQGGINPNDVYLTIMDADSWAPQGYIHEIDAKIAEKKDPELYYVFHPWQIFTRNVKEVPILNKLYCQNTSMSQVSLLSSLIDATFPLSNYTLPYKLIKNVGFWDTCADAIGEDFHTNLKVFWNGEGKVRTFPVFIPFNQLCVQTGEGVLSDVKAQFWQMERHLRGCLDFSYVLNMMCKRKLEWRAMYISIWAIELYIIQTYASWTMIAHPVRNLLGINIYANEVDVYITTRTLFDIFTVVSLIAFVIFVYYKNKASRILYKIENSFLWQLSDYIFLPMMLFFIFPASCIANYKILANKNEYEAAKKNTDREKHA